jgi:hypothetical protein
VSARRSIAAAQNAGLTLFAEGPKLIIESAVPLPEPLLAELRSHKPEVIAELARGEPPAPFCDLHATEADYAQRLIHYARQDGLGLRVSGGRLILAAGRWDDPDLLYELRAHEAAIIACLREGLESEPDSIQPAQPVEAFRPRIVRVPPFGSDTVPERFSSLLKNAGN